MGMFGVVALIGAVAGCATTATTSSTVSQKETLLAQSGFKTKTVTTPKQQQLVGQLAENKVSAVKYKGKLYYVYPTGKKDQIYVGRQAQYDAYKNALQAWKAQHASQQASAKASQEQQMLNGDPVWVGETAGPAHIRVQVFDGFGPLDPMEGD